jgi:hypothetical protein
MFKNTMEKEQQKEGNVAINSPNIIGSLNHVTKDIHYQGKEQTNVGQFSSFHLVLNPILIMMIMLDIVTC